MIGGGRAGYCGDRVLCVVDVGVVGLVVVVVYVDGVRGGLCCYYGYFVACQGVCFVGADECRGAECGYRV